MIQTNGAQDDLSNDPRNTPNVVHIQNIQPHEIGVSTRLLNVHILAATSSPRTRILDLRDFAS